jgi:hypothetical protein
LADTGNMVSLPDLSRSARAGRHVFKRGLRGFGRQPGIRHTLDWLSDHMPKGLYARSMLIIIVPIVILQGVVAFVFYGAPLADGHLPAVLHGDAEHCRDHRGL